MSDVWKPMADRIDTARDAAWFDLGNGAYTLIDADDLELISSYRWRVSAYGYAMRHSRVGGRRSTRCMHRDILGIEYGDITQVDHRNHDRLDNRRANLRVCSCGQNTQNRRPLAPHGYKGICHRKDGCWQASFKPNGKQIHLGRFDNPVDAALAYDVAAISEYGEFAWTNYLVCP